MQNAGSLKRPNLQGPSSPNALGLYNVDITFLLCFRSDFSAIDKHP